MSSLSNFKSEPARVEDIPRPAPIIQFEVNQMTFFFGSNLKMSNALIDPLISNRIPFQTFVRGYKPYPRLSFTLVSLSHLKLCLSPLVSHPWSLTLGLSPLVSHPWSLTLGLSPLVSHPLSLTLGLTLGPKLRMPVLPSPSENAHITCTNSATSPSPRIGRSRSPISRPRLRGSTCGRYRNPRLSFPRRDFSRSGEIRDKDERQLRGRSERRQGRESETRVRQAREIPV